MDTVFILGAGASAQAKVPLMADFLDKAMLLTPPRGDIESAFRLVSEARSQLQQAQSKAKLDIRNVESVFAAFEMAQLFNRLGSLKEDQIARLTDAMRTVIVHTVESYMAIRVNRRKILAPLPYGTFGALVRQLVADNHTVAILTFNYDIGLDMGLWLNELPVEYSLDDRPPAAGSIELLKLHGSLNWAVCPNCKPKTIIPRLVRDIVQDTEGHWGRSGSGPSDAQLEVSLNISSELSRLKCPRCQTNCKPEPMVVPPTASKAGLHSELQRVWQRAATCLSRANNIFVIGYSWPDGDNFFHQLYALGTVGKTILSRFWVCDIDARVRQKFLDRLLGEQARDCFWPPNESYTFELGIQHIGQAFHITMLPVPDRVGPLPPLRTGGSPRS
jgi:hypothetical protein